MFSLFKLAFWFLFWIPVYCLTAPFKKKDQENCMTWALKQWTNHGGYLTVRWCRSSKHRFKWPHFLWLPEDKHQELLHVVPEDDRCDKRYLPHPWFIPRMLKGDETKDYPEEN